MDTQPDAESLACARCGAPRAVQPDWEPGELSCVVCGARLYVPPQVTTFSFQNAPEGFLDDIYESVMEQVRAQLGERTDDVFADLLLQLRGVRHERGPKPKAVFHPGVGTCTAHSHAPWSWTIPERARLVQRPPAKRLRVVWHRDAGNA